MTLNLHWNKCVGDKWCPFLTVNLDHAAFENKRGVYIIWHGGDHPKTVYVGQGNIAERIRAHRDEQAILQYSRHGLFVTWAEVSEASMSGVERFFYDRLTPLVGDKSPETAHVQASFPW